jgi:hypothetical protein
MRPRPAIVLSLVLGLLGGSAATMAFLRLHRADHETRHEPDASARRDSPMPTVPAPAPTATPATGLGDSIEKLNADLDSPAARAAVGLKPLLARAFALGPLAAAVAKRLAERILAEADPDDDPSHRLLGHRKFAHDMPDAISFVSLREYDYLRVVENAIRHRWIESAAESEAAEAAWTKTLAHARRLQDDPTFRALVGARREVSLDRYLKDYNCAATFASPYLICYASSERVSDEELSKLSYAARQKRLAQLEASRAKFAMRLAEKATILQQLYREFLKRYGEACDLKDLMSPYGGRPDLPAGKRSYRDGCPLVVWVFEDRAAWDEFHAVVKGEPVNPGVAGYFSRSTGWAYLHDEDSEKDRELEVIRTLETGTHQLLHWFARQKREWGGSMAPQSFFDRGFADYMAAVTMAPDRSLAFNGMNRSRLELLQRTYDDPRADAGDALPLSPNHGRGPFAVGRSAASSSRTSAETSAIPTASPPP